ncbi:isocitrate/isopropylmalate dehydrogenase family protein [Amycolatopsis sp. NPDC054798]
MEPVIVIPGDGIGPEVTDEAVATLDALRVGLSFEKFDHINAEAFMRTGSSLDDDDLKRIRHSGTVLLGAIGDPRTDGTSYARGVLLRLRTELDLFINHRPARLLHQRLSPLHAGMSRDIDCVVVRENTEGLYAGVGGTLRAGTGQEVAMDVEVSTCHGVARTLDYAFAIARTGVCMVDKSNAVRFGGQLWQRCWAEAKQRHPSVLATHEYVDAAAMKLVSNPAQFDVIVTNNSYGDILSDIAAEIAGGLGTAASANINPFSGAGLFEPVHGAAPDIAGTGTANPVGAVLSGALLLERRGHLAEAAAVRKAVEAATLSGRCTPDLGGTLSTADAGSAIRAELGAQ